MSEKAMLTVGDLAADSRNALVGGPFGSNLVARDYTSAGVPVIRGQNMGGRWVSGEFAFVSVDKAKALSANTARPGDLIFTQRGTLGQVALVPEGPFDEYIVSQSQMKLTVDKTRADSLFLYYVFSSPAQIEYIRQNAIQVGVPHTNLGILRSTPLELPPISEQKRIADILGALDDKIELNRRLSETLEAIAQALFQSWFVDFDPVRAKASGEAPDSICQRLGLTQELLALFPDQLVESELGEIPEGWAWSRLESLAPLVTTSVSPSAKPHAVFEHYSIPAFDVSRLPTYELGETIKSNKYVVAPQAVLVSKLNPETKRIWLPFVKTENAVCSTEFMQFVPHSPMARTFIYLMMRSELMQLEILKRVTGSTGSRQRAQPSEIAKLMVLEPPAPILSSFDSIVKPTVALSVKLRDESKSLGEELRNSLIPQLLSGELRVPSNGAA